MTKQQEDDAQVLAYYLCGSDLESALEQAGYDVTNNSFDNHYIDVLNVIKRALEINS